jgi:ABC-2 type transport system ATP-binding protein
VRLQIHDVHKQYRGDVLALSGLSLDLGAGIVGLLGPNGAGKSTLMRILATVTRPTRGRVLWNGVDTAKEPDTLRERLGYLPQDFGVYPNLNPVEFLELVAAAKGLETRAARKRIDALLEIVNLENVRRRALGGFSGGMRQRVGIAQALLNDPLLLIVDEPTAGLDPEERVRLRHLLSELAGERIVILSTHIVSDVEAIATRIALIGRGRLLADAAPEALLQEVAGKAWLLTVASAELPSLRERHIVSGAIRRSEGVLVRVVADARPAPAAQPAEPNLEDAYLWHVTRSRLAAA